MPTSYPGALDSFDPFDPAELMSVKHRPHHNDVADGLEAVQAELGLSPSGAFASVRERLDQHGDQYMVDFNKVYSPVQSSSVDNGPKLQQALDELPTTHWLQLSGDYYTAQPLTANHGAAIRNGRILAMPDLDFSQTVLDGQGNSHGVALLMLKNVTYYAMSRIFLDGVTLHGLNVPDGRGFLGALQQPCQWANVRFDGFLDHGMKYKGQQCLFYNTMFLRCRIGLLKDPAADASFMYWFGFNAEQNTEKGAEWGGNHNMIIGGHFETNAVDLDISGRNALFANMRHSTIDPDTSYLVQPGGTDFRILGAGNGVGTNRGIAIDDPDLGQLNWWETFRGTINEWNHHAKPTASIYTDAWRKTDRFADGKLVRWGGRYAPTLSLRPPDSSQRLMVFEQTGTGTPQSVVTGAGELEYLDALLGVKLKDRTTGTVYRLKVDNGVLDVESV